MIVCSFRAECMQDVKSLIQKCIDAGVDLELHLMADSNGGTALDVTVQGEVALDVLGAIMRQARRGHRMLDSLRVRYEKARVQAQRNCQMRLQVRGAPALQGG